MENLALGKPATQSDVLWRYNNDRVFNISIGRLDISTYVLHIKSPYKGISGVYIYQTPCRYKPGLAVDGDSNSCSFTARTSTGPRWWQVAISLSLN